MPFTAKVIEIENRVFREINQDFIFRQNRTAISKIYVQHESVATDIGKSHHGHECPRTDMLVIPAQNNIVSTTGSQCKEARIGELCVHHFQFLKNLG